MKCRIWNKEYCEMLYCKPVIQEFDFEGGIVLSFPPVGYTGFWAHECYDKRKPDVDISWSTGRLDKNEKEIYGGDILKTYPILASDAIGDDSFNVIVRFDGSSWIANGTLGDYQCRISEVIGNIYENPELITKGETK